MRAVSEAAAAIVDPRGAFIKASSGALDEIAKAMDKHGTSAWISGVGLLLIVYGLSMREGHWSHLRSGELIAVLVIGLIFMLIGVSYRLYTRIAADAAVRRSVKDQLDRANTLEQRSAEQRRSADDTIKQLAAGAPKG